MARQDSVHLYGIVYKTEVITDDGEPILGKAFVTCVRGYRYLDNKDGSIRYDRPLVVSKDPLIIEKIGNLKDNDVVMVKGTVATATMHKTMYCPECGEAVHKDTQLTYVNPIDLFVVNHYGEDDEGQENAREDLLRHREFSNELLAVGTLRKKPVLFRTMRGIDIAEFQLNIARKFRIITDDPMKRHDDPWVKVYGEMGLDCKLRLDIGSDVLVDGFIMTRKTKRTTKCPHCDKFFSWMGTSMEIVPYAVEYLDNYLTDEAMELKGVGVEQARQSLYDSIEDVDSVID